MQRWEVMEMENRKYEFSDDALVNEDGNGEAE